MIPQFTPEQRDALNAQHGHVVYFVDIVTNEEYAVVPADKFRQVEPLLDQGELDVRDLYAAQESAFAKIWNDPALDVYNAEPLPPIA